MPQFAIHTSALNNMMSTFNGRRVKTKKLGGEEEYGKVVCPVLLGGDTFNSTGAVAVGTAIGFLVETDAGAMEVWQAGTLVPHRQLPVDYTLLDDVRLGDLSPEKFAEIIGIPLDIAEGLIEAHEKKSAEQT